MQPLMTSDIIMTIVVSVDIAADAQRVFFFFLLCDV